MTYFQYIADRARRIVCGIDEQVAKAEKADPTTERVIGAYHQLWRIEQPMRMSAPASTSSPPIGPAGEGAITYLLLEREREVHVLLIQWAG